MFGGGPGELEAMIRATGGVPVQYGGRATWGHLDTADESAFDGAEVIGTELSVAVATGTLGRLEVDAAITVDGTEYVVRDHRRVQDGATTRIWLAEP